MGIVPELEAEHGPLRWPLDDDLGTVHRGAPPVAQAERIAWDELTAGAMADSWAAYLSRIAGAADRPKLKLTLRAHAAAQPATRGRRGVCPVGRRHPPLERRDHDVPAEAAAAAGHAAVAAAGGLPCAGPLCRWPRAATGPLGPRGGQQRVAAGTLGNWLRTLKRLQEDDPRADA